MEAIQKMNIQRLAFWAGLFCILLLYVTVVDTRLFEKRAAPPSGPKKIFPVSPAEINAIEILAGMQQAVISRRDDLWELSAPAQKTVTAEILESFVGALLDAVVIKTVEEYPENLAAYELDNPRFTIRIFLRNASRPRILHLGKNSPSSVTMYALSESEHAVFLTGTYLRFSLQTFLGHVYNNSSTG